jgi:serine/threonine-protein kinase
MESRTPAPTAASAAQGQPATAPSLGKSARIVVPDAIGLSVLDAHALVREQGLRIAISVWQTKIGPWGLILSQHPEPGSVVDSGSPIQVVGAGRPHLTVPEVRGLPMTAAMDVLRRLGLRPDVSSKRSSRSVAVGSVISTQPRAGSLIADGSRITLHVSRGRSETS